MKHKWTRPVWQEGRVLQSEDGNGDTAFWRMEEVAIGRVPVFHNISAEYDQREEMGR
jgi:hypothetical protein